MDHLLQVKGTGKGSLYSVTDSLLVGRSIDCDIRLEDRDVSREHARITRKKESVQIKDLDSQNGTFINGKQVPERTLESGDEIRLGSCVLVFNPEFEIQVDWDGDALIMHDPDEEPPDIRVRPARPRKGPADATGNHMELLYRATRCLVETLDRKQLLSNFLRETVNGLNASRGAILTRPTPDAEPEVEHVFSTGSSSDAHMTISRTLLREVLENENAVLCPDATEDPRFEGSQSIQRADIASFMAVPMMKNDDPIGVLYVDTLNLLRTFQERDLSALETLGHQAGMVLSQIHAFEKSQKETDRLRNELSEDLTIVGESREMKRVLDTAKKVAETDSTVLLTGETGTGKELISRAIHHNSRRRDGPFVPVDCSTISEQLLESELFGHVEGAFTGATEDREGKFEAADGGTLFLDEIGNLSDTVQKKLLRFIETRSFTRVGEVKVRNVDVRIIAATNRDLKQYAEEGHFREDLYFRLAVVPIELPPLRDRQGDIPRLIDYFIHKITDRMDRPPPEITGEAMDILKQHDWPGNVRELRNAVEQALVFSNGQTIRPAHLPSHLKPNTTGEPPHENRETESDPAGETGRISVPSSGPLEKAIEVLEEKRIRQSLKKNEGKKGQTARDLGISRPTLNRKIEKYDLDPDE